MEDHADSSEGDSEGQETVTLSVKYHGQNIDLTFPAAATIADLSSLVESDLSIPPEVQKFIVSPKPGMLKPPFKDPYLSLSSLVDRKISLLGSTTTELADLDTALASMRSKQAARASALRQGRKVQVWKRADSRKAQDEATYTFGAIRAMQGLPGGPAKSQRFLERLAADPGIKAAMRKHKFSVGLLTEMDPASHTTHESRTLGLNRNAGEVIELRLRTDAYDGFRDYKVIRKTLCHELTHNVWGDHDRNFWDLCKEIEKEVDAGDWTSGGNSVGAEEFYNPADPGMGDDEADHGGWTGGAYVLGRASATSSTGTSTPLNRREAMAQAAEERMKKQQPSTDKDKQSPS